MRPPRLAVTNAVGSTTEIRILRLDLDVVGGRSGTQVSRYLVMRRGGQSRPVIV
jgi:hypothetical protein